MKLRFMVLLDLVALVLGGGCGAGEQVLKFVFVIFRHGERTPSNYELSYLRDKDIRHLKDHNFYPFGTEALTNNGKERAYRVGEYLRARYGNFLSTDYLPPEILVRSTDYARNKMSALLALASLYEPSKTDEQQWNAKLKWQPIPYEYLPFEMDDLLYWHGCPRYQKLRNDSYNTDAIREKMSQYKDVLKELSKRSSKEIQTPLDVNLLDSLISSLKSYDLKVPDWLSKFEKEIGKAMTIEYEAKFRTTEMIRLAAGPMMTEVFDTMDLVQKNDSSLEMKMYLVSGNEQIMLAWMQACRAERPLESLYYGATFSIEISYVPEDQDYRVQLFYLPGSSEKKPTELEVRLCTKHSKKKYCTIDGFKSITSKYKMSYSEYLKECRRL